MDDTSSGFETHSKLLAIASLGLVYATVTACDNLLGICSDDAEFLSANFMDGIWAITQINAAPRILALRHRPHVVIHNDGHRPEQV